MTTLEAMAKEDINKADSLEWEWVRCNLCGADATDLYHRERLPYFDETLVFEIVQCRRCGLVYTNPRLADHNATYLCGGRDETEGLAGHDRAKEQVFADALDEITQVREADDKQGPGRLLDVGCGSGHFLMLAEKRGLEVSGIEPAEASADYAEREYSLAVMHRSVLEVELPEASFDVITAWDVIEHVSDPQAVLQRCVRWLRPGGIMALRFPSARWQKLKGVVLHRWLASERPAFSPTMHLYFFNEDTFARLAGCVGLEVVRTKTTALERNGQHHLVDAVKAVSSMAMRGWSALSGVHVGNLEVYCRKMKDA